jgi:hypothetical protein
MILRTTSSRVLWYPVMVYTQYQQVTISKPSALEEANMTIIIASPPETKLKEMATREGRDENTLADARLAEVLEAANRDHSEMMEGIERGRQAYAEGRPRISAREDCHLKTKRINKEQLT